MECVGSYRIGLIGTVISAGYAVGSLIIPRLSDIYGRKPVVCVNMVVNLFIYAGLMASRNLN